MADDTWDLAQTDAPPAVVPPPSAGAAPSGIDYAAIAKQLLQQPTLPQPDTTPVTRGLLSRIGEALGGGQVSGVMSPAQQEMAGLRSLRDFGTSLIAGSGYYPGKPALGAFAEGFQGAERSQRGSEQQAAATLAAQQQYAAGQQQQYLARLKEALPLLRMDAGANIPNALLSANTPAVPGTAGGAGRPGGGGVALTPFIAKNLPAGVTPAEDQMVRTVIGEAGGEPLTGQQGVAAVIKNRMNLGKQDAQSVIFAPNQFEPWNNPATRAKLEGIDPGSQLYQDILNKAVRPVMSGDAPDPTGGATNFYSPTAQKALGRDTPSWAAGQTPSTVIGGHQFYKLPFGPGTQFAGLGAPTGGPAATPAPITPAPTETPPAASTAPAPPAPPTFADFQAKNPIPTTPEEQATLDGLRRVQQQTATELQNAPLTGVDRVKAVQAAREAADNLATATRGIQDAHTAHQVTLYNADQQRQAQAGIETQKIEAQAAEAERQRQAAERLENIKAGNTYHQELDKQSAQYAQDNTIKPMAAQATKAHQMNLGLSQLLPVLQDLPKGGGALGTVLDAHPDLAPLFNTAGILTDRSADAVRLVNGLVSNISTEMKPAGLGALREYEWDAFKAQLPSLLSTPAGQQKAVAMLMNMNDRIAQEHSWMNNYFNRKVPDDMSAKPGAMRSAHNLDTDGGESAQQRMDRELGPIIPSLTGQLSGANQAQWEQSLPPGKPYYKVWAVPDPKNPGQPRRDANGNVMTTKTLEVRPWQ